MSIPTRVTITATLDMAWTSDAELFDALRELGMSDITIRYTEAE